MKYWMIFPALHKKLSKFAPNRLQALGISTMVFVIPGIFALILGIRNSNQWVIAMGTTVTGVFGGIALLLLVWDLAGTWLKGEPARADEKPYRSKITHLLAAGEGLVLVVGAASTGVVAYVNGFTEVIIFLFKVVVVVAAICFALILAGRLFKERPRASNLNILGAIEFVAFGFMIGGLFFLTIIHFVLAESVMQSSGLSYFVSELATAGVLLITWTLTMCAIYLVSTAVELATRGRDKDKPAE